MRVLLTGATGFVGRYLVQQLVEQDIDFITVGRNNPSGHVNHIHADLLATDDFVPIIKAASATHLIHLAWYAEHGKYWTSPLNLEWMKTTSRLVETFCQQGGEHITISGSCAEYDWRYGYCNEILTPANPATVYGIAKDTTRRLTENICNQYAVPLAWGRIFFPYGRGEAPARLIPSLFSVFRHEKRAFGVNADSYRDLLHVTDVARAFMMLMQKKATGTINICSGVPLAIAEVVRSVAELERGDPDIVLRLHTERAGEPKLLVGSNEKLSGLGWKMQVPLHQGLKDFII